MLTAVVLICSLHSPADLGRCDRTNAIDVLIVPDLFANPTACFMQGQVRLAAMLRGRSLRPDEGVKVVCQQRDVPRTAALCSDAYFNGRACNLRAGEWNVVRDQQ